MGQKIWYATLSTTGGGSESGIAKQGSAYGYSKTGHLYFSGNQVPSDANISSIYMRGIQYKNIGNTWTSKTITFTNNNLQFIRSGTTTPRNFLENSGSTDWFDMTSIKSNITGVSNYTIKINNDDTSTSGGYSSNYLGIVGNVYLEINYDDDIAPTITSVTSYGQSSLTDFIGKNDVRSDIPGKGIRIYFNKGSYNSFKIAISNDNNSGWGFYTTYLSASGTSPSFYIDIDKENTKTLLHQGCYYALSIQGKKDDDSTSDWNDYKYFYINKLPEAVSLIAQQNGSNVTRLDLTQNATFIVSAKDDYVSPKGWVDNKRTIYKSVYYGETKLGATEDSSNNPNWTTTNLSFTYSSSSLNNLLGEKVGETIQLTTKVGDGETVAFNTTDSEYVLNSQDFTFTVGNNLSCGLSIYETTPRDPDATILGYNLTVVINSMAIDGNSYEWQETDQIKLRIYDNDHIFDREFYGKEGNNKITFTNLLPMLLNNNNITYFLDSNKTITLNFQITLNNNLSYLVNKTYAPGNRYWFKFKVGSTPRTEIDGNDTFIYPHGSTPGVPIMLNSTKITIDWMYCQINDEDIQRLCVQNFKITPTIILKEGSKKQFLLGTKSEIGLPNVSSGKIYIVINKPNNMASTELNTPFEIHLDISVNALNYTNSIKYPEDLVFGGADDNNYSFYEQKLPFLGSINYNNYGIIPTSLSDGTGEQTIINETLRSMTNQYYKGNTIVIKNNNLNYEYTCPSDEIIYNFSSSIDTDQSIALKTSRSEVGTSIFTILDEVIVYVNSSTYSCTTNSKVSFEVNKTFPLDFTLQLQEYGTNASGVDASIGTSPLSLPIGSGNFNSFSSPKQPIFNEGTKIKLITE